ncbi:hypothetical protein IMG5_034830 [Ichthyophthirius multifiliis]|uniref:39S ribosomal protein L19, mitochondrial n=1 Tax=Ichthyophthirius multifiliis TaxID=5932 RepID=G0QLQ5_ICHMU|nr:hypothetical protein IMG5_034830 [Ichthyophthirius multifiliis]EGR33851.1 hypothetical protein IMG5_034830 [Ichthyophthirius multifiliis]|eukprot:XP_004039075.1 hypothetical protein IMG5_034830 [Ichthyophthirius multifiliis]
MTRAGLIPVLVYRMNQSIDQYIVVDLGVNILLNLAYEGQSFQNYIKEISQGFIFEAVVQIFDKYNQKHDICERLSVIIQRITYNCQCLEKIVINSNIVYRYKPQRSPFDKTNYIDNYVPRPNHFHPDRKPKQLKWDDPNYEWPPVILRPTQLKGKALIKHIEQREKLALERQKEFRIPEFKAGDVIEIHYLKSLSEGYGNTVTGLCTARYKQNSLMSGFDMVFRFCGAQVFMHVKLFSPFLKSLKVIQTSEGTIRYKLNYIWYRNNTDKELRTPISSIKFI